MEPGLMAGRQAGSLADTIWVRLEILKPCSRSKYLIFRFVSATLMHCYCFFRQILPQGCFMECEILQSPMISY